MSEACRHEPHIRRAAAEDKWSAALREHVETCADCRAAAAIAPFMSRFARADQRQPVLPPASVIWVKAQLMRGTAVVDRVSRPINLMQIAAYLSVAAAWAGMLTWKWVEIQRTILSFAPSHMAEGISTGSSVSLTLVATVVILGSATFGLALHTILAEE